MGCDLHILFYYGGYCLFSLQFNVISFSYHIFSLSFHIFWNSVLLFVYCLWATGVSVVSKRIELNLETQQAPFLESDSNEN